MTFLKSKNPFILDTANVRPRKLIHPFFHIPISSCDDDYGNDGDGAYSFYYCGDVERRICLKVTESPGQSGISLMKTHTWTR